MYYRIINGIAGIAQTDIKGFEGLWAANVEGFATGDLYDEKKGWSHPVKTSKELEAESRKWRDEELQTTDSIVAITDHSNHTALMSYRQELRDWTDTKDFPATKPTKP